MSSVILSPDGRSHYHATRTALLVNAVNPIGDIWNLNQNNSIYWNSVSADETGNDYVMDITTDNLYANTIKETKITGCSGMFDGAIRINMSSSVEGVIVRDSIANKLSSGCRRTISRPRRPTA